MDLSLLVVRGTSQNLFLKIWLPKMPGYAAKIKSFEMSIWGSWYRESA